MLKPVHAEGGTCFGVESTQKKRAYIVLTHAREAVEIGVRFEPLICMQVGWGLKGARNCNNPRSPLAGLDHKRKKHMCTPDVKALFSSALITPTDPCGKQTCFLPAAWPLSLRRGGALSLLRVWRRQTPSHNYVGIHHCLCRKTNVCLPVSLVALSLPQTRLGGNCTSS